MEGLRPQTWYTCKVMCGLPTVSISYINSYYFSRYSQLSDGTSFKYYCSFFFLVLKVILTKVYTPAYQMKAHTYISPEGQIPIRIFPTSNRLEVMALPLYPSALSLYLAFTYI